MAKGCSEEESVTFASDTAVEVLWCFAVELWWCGVRGKKWRVVHFP